MNKTLRIGFIGIVACILAASNTSAQSSVLGQDLKVRSGDTIRTVTTAVPFMVIAPDARSGALGEAGVAISSDANAVHWNPGKLPFAENQLGMALTVTPWLGKLGIKDMYLSYLSGYYKLTKERVIYGSLTFFDLGDIQFTDENGTDLQIHNPTEYNLTSGYAMKFSKTLGVGVSLKYIYSNLSGQQALAGGGSTKPGQTAAADLSTYYTKDMVVNAKKANLAAGLSISNVGAKIAYTNSGEERDFIPTNMRLGTAFKYEIDPYQNFMITVDANKLLVPSPPLYAVDAGGVPLADDNGDPIIAAGSDPDRGVASGIFGSFSDAPGYLERDEDGNPVEVNGVQQIEKGSRTREEFQEIVWNFGAEYWYDNLLAFRAGYFYEHRLKGARQFITVGFGLRYQMLGIDAAYIIPFNPQHPLAETVRVGLTLNMNDLGKGKEESIIE